jgi:fibronectin type 3 domain-containing protein
VGARLAGGVALALALALAGCAALRQRLGDAIVAEGLALSFDRRVDLLPPEGLRVTSTADRSIALAWDPVLVGDVAGYAILRAARPDAPYALVGQTTSRFGTVHTDQGSGPQRLGDGQGYHYRVHPYDAQGRVSRSHAYLHAATDPRPEAPRGLHAYSSLPRRVVLVWEPHPDPSVAGYSIERSPTVAGPWEAVGGSESRLETVYEDGVPGDLRVMYYRVLARNRFGGQSDLTEPVRAVTKAEPLPPVGLAVRASTLGRIDLAWEPNVEPDVAAYEIWRSPIEAARRGPLERIGTVARDARSFSDTSVGCGARVRYRLRAVDEDGLLSAFSGPLEVEALGLGLALETPLSLTWNAGRVPPEARVSLVRLRDWWPDQTLPISAAGRAELPELGAGRHRIVAIVELMPLRGGATAPLRCELTLDVSS